MVTLVLLNVLAAILVTDDRIEDKYKNFFYCFELVSTILFACEYVLRLWSVASLHKYRYPTVYHGRIRFIFEFMSIVDLVSTLPGIIEYAAKTTTAATTTAATTITTNNHTTHQDYNKKETDATS